MKNWMIASLLALACAAQAQVADSESNFGSLYPKVSRSFIESRTATRKGDVLTVIVDERMDGSLAATTTATKKDTTTVGRTELPGVTDVLKWLRIPTFGILGNKSSNADSSVAGNGTTTSQQRLTGRLTVTVIEVQPNGNLQIEGSKTLLLNKERVNFVVSGIVRRDDILPDNTVLSSKVAEAEIRATGRGLISDRQRRGILTRVLEWLF